jgi:flagellar biosynthetic protein FliR
MGCDFGDASWGGMLDRAGIWVLALARVLGLCLTAPGLAVPHLDWRCRAGLAAMLGAALVPVVEPQIASALDGSSVARIAVIEVFTGGVLGFAASLIVAGARFGGDMLAVNAGLSTASLFDAESGEEMTLLGRFYEWVALAVFVALDGPLIMVGALVESYQAMPPGGRAISRETVDLAVAQVGRALELSLRAAAPAAIALILAGLVVGWLSRSAASLPFGALALPIRTVVGIILVVLTLGTLVATLSTAWSTLPWLP